MKRYCLAFVVLLSVTAVANCVCLNYVGLNTLNYPRQWYNESYDQSPNNTIIISAMVPGNTPIRILDSDSDKINFSVFYYRASDFKEVKHEDDSIIAMYTYSDNDGAKGIGADIYLSLPGNANYTVNIWNMAAGDSSAYKNASMLMVNYTRGNLTFWLNDRGHPLPLEYY